MTKENQVASVVVDAAMKIHRDLGPGLLESVYETALAYELGKRGLQVRTQVGIPVIYEGVPMGIGFRADLLVEECLIVEIKSVEALPSVAYKVLLTYLKVSGLRLGILLNFGEERMKDGIRRVVNGLPDDH